MRYAIIIIIIWAVIRFVGKADFIFKCVFGGLIIFGIFQMFDYWEAIMPSQRIHLLYKTMTCYFDKQNVQDNILR